MSSVMGYAICLKIIVWKIRKIKMKKRISEQELHIGRNCVIIINSTTTFLYYSFSLCVINFESISWNLINDSLQFQYTHSVFPTQSLENIENHKIFTIKWIFYDPLLSIILFSSICLETVMVLLKCFRAFWQ